MAEKLSEEMYRFAEEMMGEGADRFAEQAHNAATRIAALEEEIAEMQTQQHREGLAWDFLVDKLGPASADVVDAAYESADAELSEEADSDGN